MNRPRSLETIAPELRSTSKQQSGSLSSTSTEEIEFDHQSPSMAMGAESDSFLDPLFEFDTTTQPVGAIDTLSASSLHVLPHAPPPASTDSFRIREQSSDSLDDQFESNAQPGSKRKLFAILPSWMVSTAFHLCVLLFLALVIPSAVETEQPLELKLGHQIENSVFLDEMEIEDLAASVEVQPEFQMMAAAATSNVSDVVREEGVVASLEEFNGIGEALFESYAEGDAPANLGGGGDTGDQAKMEQGTGTRFFGAEAYGRRFVFVVDGSRSMLENRRWDRMVEEIIQSINVLTEQEEVFVMVYDNFTHPMLNMAPEEIELTPVTEEFKRAFFQWLSLQRPDGGTMPAHAMAVALKLEPDAIFLLSDGMINDNTPQTILELNVEREWPDGKMKKTPIHTISLGPGGGANVMMQYIARSTGGKFRWVK